MSVLKNEKKLKTPNRRVRRSEQLREDVSPVSTRFDDKPIREEATDNSPPSIRKRFLRKSVSQSDSDELRVSMVLLRKLTKQSSATLGVLLSRLTNKAVQKITGQLGKRVSQNGWSITKGKTIGFLLFNIQEIQERGEQLDENDLQKLLSQVQTTQTFQNCVDDFDPVQMYKLKPLQNNWLKLINKAEFNISSTYERFIP